MLYQSNNKLNTGKVVPVNKKKAKNQNKMDKTQKGNREIQGQSLS